MITIRIPETPEEALGLALAAHRQQAGLSQLEFATAWGVAQSSVARWENGSNSMAVATLLVREEGEAIFREAGRLWRNSRAAASLPPQPLGSDVDVRPGMPKM